MASGNVASADLIWLLTKKGTSFTHKRSTSARLFSTEKGNLKNIHAHRYSGIANEKVIDVQPSASNYGVTISTFNPLSSSLKKDSKKVKGKGGRKTAGAVTKVAAGEKGRLDLRGDALARASAILASQAAKKEVRQRALRGNKVEA
ncbi:hypothetical protein MNV49_005970 [Pseudohyphozyma bogoriensis]|nr:hypothetical protein MNV49_005970 [Pseudohyphozyma bogoriensis]